MIDFGNIYETQATESEVGNKYFFVSEGNQDVIKAIQYSFIQQLNNQIIEELNGRNVYNLGFGDYDSDNDTLNDLANTNNGDHYKVFNTVLSTIPTFFEAYKGMVLMVHGSDGRQSFIESCKPACSRKCTNECKNFKRRINIYRRYVNKHYDLLSVDFQFIGGILNNEGSTDLESYIVGKEYDSVLLFQKNV